MLSFNFSEKILELVYPPHFVYGFSRKIILILHSFPDQILLFDSLSSSKYCTISVLQLFVDQAVTS